MKVKELMRTRRLVSVTPDDDLSLAAQIMRWAGVRHLPVVSADREVVGVLTERDLLRVRAEARDAENLGVRQYMTAPVQVITPEEEVAAACALMLAGKIGCLPVVDEKSRLLGIVTTTDLLGSQISSEMGSAGAAAARVEMAMRRDFAVVPPHSPLLEAVALMVDRAAHHVLVTSEKGKVVGILSDRDVRTAIGDPSEALGREDLTEVEELKVSGVMTTAVITVREEARLADVARLFVDERVGALPVVDDRGHPVGIVSYVDVIRALLAPLEGASHTPDDGSEAAAPSAPL